MDAPQFIFDLFESELRNIQKDLLKNVATKFNLNHEELVKEFLPEKLKLIPNTKISVSVHKKVAPRELPANEKRCMARVWNRGKGGQCTRFRMSSSCEYCNQHEKNLKHGRIDETIKDKIFPKSANSLYK
jgi:hypothetical protein